MDFPATLAEEKHIYGIIIEESIRLDKIISIYSYNFEDILKKLGEIMRKYRLLDDILWGLNGYKVKFNYK